MSISTSSRDAVNPFADPTIPNLFDLAQAIRSRVDLSSRERSDRVSALNTVSRAVDQPLVEVPAHPRFLRKKLQSVNPVRSGIAPTTWRNARSLLNRTLREHGFDVMPGRYLAPIAPIWRPLWDQLPERPFKISLSRFIRFCSTRGVAPHEVCEATFGDFDQALEHESLIDGVEVRSRDTRRYWNEATRKFQQWPQVQVQVPNRRVTYRLDGGLPASLVAEFDRFRDALTGDIFDHSLEVKPIRPVSATSKLRELERLACAAIRGGIDPIQIDSLAALVRPAVVRAGLQEIRRRNGDRVLRSMDTLLAHVISTARHWVNAPQADIGQLTRMKTFVGVKPGLMCESTERILRDLEDVEVIRRLAALPRKVFEEVERADRVKRSDAVRVQAALAIALLLRAPVRPKNLASIHLQRNLISVGVGRARKRHLRFPGHEVKNSADLEFPLTPEVEVLLETYLRRYRPSFMRKASDFLFCGEEGQAKGTALLSCQVGDLTEERLGTRLTVHKFRAVAGAIMLRADPTAQEVVRQILGHRSVATTTNYYAPINAGRAIALYDEVLDRVLHEGEGAQ